MTFPVSDLRESPFNYFSEVLDIVMPDQLRGGMRDFIKHRQKRGHMCLGVIQLLRAKKVNDLVEGVSNHRTDHTAGSDTNRTRPPAFAFVIFCH